MPCFRLASWRDLPNKLERKSWERIERVRALERIESSPLLIYKNRQRACRILCPAIPGLCRFPNYLRGIGFPKHTFLTGFRIGGEGGGTRRSFIDSFKRFFRFPFPRLSRGNFLGKLNTLFIGERSESVPERIGSSPPFASNFPNAIQDKLVKLSKTDTFLFPPVFREN